MYKKTVKKTTDTLKKINSNATVQMILKQQLWKILQQIFN